MDYGQGFFVYTAAIKIVDAVVVVGVWYLCWYLRFDSSFFPITKGIPEFREYILVSLPLALVFSAVFHVVGAYRRDRIFFGFRALKKIVQGAVMGTLVFIAYLYFRNEFRFSRVYLALFSVLVVVGLVADRAFLHLLWSVLERRVIRKVRILLVGTGDLLQMYLHQIQRREPYPIHWIGRLGVPEEEGPLGALPHLGSEGDLLTVLARRPADMVVVSYPTDQSTRYQAILESVSNELVGVKVLPDFGKYSTFTYSAEHECGIPLLVFNQSPMGSSDRFKKRLFDILASVAIFAVFWPLYLLIWCLVKATSKGPGLYSQMRVGADGRVFQCYKFRSMHLDAEAKTGAVWAKAGDDRTTKLGKWLRKSSLDELPQVYNVLRGEMSLVGPRPERPVFVDQFRRDVPKYMLRHKVKSGITGWAQVNGWRGNTSIEERIKHDLYYIGHWSLLFDVKILCLTLLRGFFNRHAY